MRIDTGLDSAHACTRSLLGKMRLRAPRALPRNNLRREIHDNRDYPREFRMQVSPRSHGVCLQAPRSVLFRAIRSISTACVREHFSVPTDVSIISVTFTLLPYYFPLGLRSRATAVREEKSVRLDFSGGDTNDGEGPRLNLYSTLLKNMLKAHGVKARGRANDLFAFFSFSTLSIVFKTIYFRFHSSPAPRAFPPSSSSLSYLSSRT